MLHRDFKTRFKIGLFIGLLIVILGYSGFQARKILGGPSLVITSPIVEGVLDDPYVKVSGVARNIKQITLNGNQIFIDEQGNFNEKLLLFAGYNIIKIEARDKFNKETEKTIEVVYQDIKES